MEEIDRFGRFRTGITCFESQLAAKTPCVTAHARTQRQRRWISLIQDCAALLLPFNLNHHQHRFNDHGERRSVAHARDRAAAAENMGAGAAWRRVPRSFPFRMHHDPCNATALHVTAEARSWRLGEAEVRGGYSGDKGGVWEIHRCAVLAVSCWLLSSDFPI